MFKVAKKQNNQLLLKKYFIFFWRGWGITKIILKMEIVEKFVFNCKGSVMTLIQALILENNT